MSTDSRIPELQKKAKVGSEASGELTVLESLLLSDVNPPTIPEEEEAKGDKQADPHEHNTVSSDEQNSIAPIPHGQHNSASDDPALSVGVDGSEDKRKEESGGDTEEADSDEGSNSSSSGSSSDSEDSSSSGGIDDTLFENLGEEDGVGEVALPGAEKEGGSGDEESSRQGVDEEGASREGGQHVMGGDAGVSEASHVPSKYLYHKAPSKHPHPRNDLVQVYIT